MGLEVVELFAYADTCRDSRSCTDRSGNYFVLIRQQNLSSPIPLFNMLRKLIRASENTLATVGRCALFGHTHFCIRIGTFCLVSVFSVVTS